jgi:sn-glycerol 3-phosphate transport system substrate-binding protein
MKSLKLFASLAAIAAATMAGPAFAKTKVELWQGLTGDLGDAVTEVCQRFNASQQDYELVCTSQGSYDAAVQNSIAAFRAQKHPTIVQVFDAGTLDLMLSGAFLPATKLMADNGYQVKWDDYFPGIANYYATSSGELYSFPFNSSTALFYYNKDALAKIGQAEPPKTWEEVETTARALKAAGYECPFAFEYDTWQILEQFSAIHDQPIATMDNGYKGLNGELVFNKTKFADLITFLKKGFDEGIYQIKVKDTGQTLTEAFAAGTCQMAQFSVASHGTVTKTQPEGMNWDVQPLPVFAGTTRKNSLVGGASLWVLSGKSAEEYKGAAAFLNFIAQPEQALFWSTRTGYIPVTRSGYDGMVASGFYNDKPYKGRERAIESLTASDVGPNSRGIRLGGYIQIRKETRDALQAIFANQMSVEAGLQQAVDRGNAILRRFEKTYEGKALP